MEELEEPIGGNNGEGGGGNPENLQAGEGVITCWLWPCIKCNFKNGASTLINCERVFLELKTKCNYNNGSTVTVDC
jgi:hypothetical protein